MLKEGNRFVHFALLVERKPSIIQFYGLAGAGRLGLRSGDRELGANQGCRQDPETPTYPHLRFLAVIISEQRSVA
jgi:hypothetical protein